MEYPSGAVLFGSKRDSQRKHVHDGELCAEWKNEPGTDTPYRIITDPQNYSGCLRVPLGKQLDCKETRKVFVGKGLFCVEIVEVVKKKSMHLSKLAELHT